MVGAVLADFGADVIKVEHRDRLDNARLRGRPVVNGKPLEGPVEELSPYFHQNNRGKRSVTIDIKHPEGLKLCRQLAARSDIVIENLARGVFQRRGLDLAELCAENPNLIAVSMSGVGESGPLSNLRVYAPVMTGLSGMDSLVGYADDRELGMVNLAIGDPNAASHTLVAVLAALLARERDGRGRFLDVPQIEALLAPMAEAVAQHQVAGCDPRLGAARPPGAAPCGHYPCSGESTWIAIAVESDAEWQELASVLGGALADRRYDSAKARRDAAELDGLVGERTRSWDRDDLTRALLRRGVPAAPVHELDELLANEHLRDRGLFVQLEHPYDGSQQVARTPWNLTRTPAIPSSSAPLVGEHTDEVLRDVLGLDPEAIQRLRDCGALR
jgi:crotonobetainyl-CoA:carnitine CoA-transferase CaiB-like acyl-CoA transferase